jgi:hypothetical protein
MLQDIIIGSLVCAVDPIWWMQCIAKGASDGHLELPIPLAQVH